MKTFVIFGLFIVSTSTAVAGGSVLPNGDVLFDDGSRRVFAKNMDELRSALAPALTWKPDRSFAFTDYDDEDEFTAELRGFESFYSSDVELQLDLDKGMITLKRVFSFAVEKWRASDDYDEDDEYYTKDAKVATYVDTNIISDCTFAPSKAAYSDKIFAIEVTCKKAEFLRFQEPKGWTISGLEEWRMMNGYGEDEENARSPRKNQQIDEESVRVFSLWFNRVINDDKVLEQEIQIDNLGALLEDENIVLKMSRSFYLSKQDCEEVVGSKRP